MSGFHNAAAVQKKSCLQRPNSTPLARPASPASRDGFICFSDFHGIKKTSIALQQG
jgi:hypothetical protein